MDDNVIAQWFDPDGLPRVWSIGKEDELDVVLCVACDLLIAYLNTGKLSVSHLTIFDFTLKLSKLKEG